MDANVLKAISLVKGYGPTPVLNGLTLELPQGKIVGLLGPNGSGKTTLLKLVAGLLTPDAGTIEVCGIPVGVQTKALVSYLPDRTYFDQNMKISEQLDYFSDFYEDFDRNRAEQLLRDLGVPLNVKFRTLSKGAREKVQLVLVMARRARLYLLDEPIAGVDPAAREYILNTILRNFQPGATVVISTHLIADVEEILDDYIFLYQGQIVRGGDARSHREQTGQTLDQLFREVFRCLQNY